MAEETLGLNRHDETPSLVPLMFEGRELTSEELNAFGERYVGNPMGVIQLYRDIGIYVLEQQASEKPDETIRRDYNYMMEKALERISARIVGMGKDEFLRSPFCYKPSSQLAKIGDNQSILRLENIVHGCLPKDAQTETGHPPHQVLLKNHQQDYI